MRNSKGFTLIELLAVIVILAIIALIAVPIVLKIVDEAERSSWIVSGQNYQKAVEQTLLKSTLNSSNNSLPSDCEVNEDGNLICVGNENLINIEISGDKPRAGYLNLKKGQIINMRLVYEDRTLITTSNGDIIISEYEPGEEVKFDSSVALQAGMKWYVIGEDKDTVNLMINYNIDESSWGTSMNEGPTSVMNSVIESFDDVYKQYGESSGLELIKDYTYINNKDGKEYLYGYQKLEIKNGKTTITTKDGTPTELNGNTYARIITEEEYVDIVRNMPGLSLLELKQYIIENIDVLNEEYSTNYTTVEEILSFSNLENNYINIFFIAYMADCLKDDVYNEVMPQSWIYDNMYTEENPVEVISYWALTSRSNTDNDTARGVFIYGMLIDTNGISTEKMVGPRPVITVSKSKIEKID